ASLVVCSGTVNPRRKHRGFSANVRFRSGTGGGNRTRDLSLEGSRVTTTPLPRSIDSIRRRRIRQAMEAKNREQRTMNREPRFVLCPLSLILRAYLAPRSGAAPYGIC